MKITNPTGKTQIAYFSRSTGLKVKEVSETPQGNIVSLITEYTDVDGVKFPKAITQSVGPQSFDIVFDAITVNDDTIDAKYDI